MALPLPTPSSIPYPGLPWDPGQSRLFVLGGTRGMSSSDSVPAPPPTGSRTPSPGSTCLHVHESTFHVSRVHSRPSGSGSCTGKTGGLQDTSRVRPTGRTGGPGRPGYDVASRSDDLSECVAYTGPVYVYTRPKDAPSE